MRTIKAVSANLNHSQFWIWNIEIINYSKANASKIIFNLISKIISNKTIVSVAEEPKEYHNDDINGINQETRRQCSKSFTIPNHL